jgi:hypothetical protein
VNSEDAKNDEDVKSRIGLACGVMPSLCSIWKAKKMTK